MAGEFGTQLAPENGPNESRLWVDSGGSTADQRMTGRASRKCCPSHLTAVHDSRADSDKLFNDVFISPKALALGNGLIIDGLNQARVIVSLARDIDPLRNRPRGLCFLYSPVSVHDADVGQMAIFLRVVDAVAGYELVADTKADEIDRHLDFPPLRLVEQRASP